MAKERISANVERQTRLRVKKAAETLEISESQFIAQAIETDLDKLDIRKALKTTCAERDKAEAMAEEARRQRDHFKAEFDDALSQLNVAESKIKVLQKRGLFARIFNLKPIL